MATNDEKFLKLQPYGFRRAGVLTQRPAKCTAPTHNAQTAHPARHRPHTALPQSWRNPQKARKGPNWQDWLYADTFDAADLAQYCSYNTPVETVGMPQGVATNDKKFLKTQPCRFWGGPTLARRISPAVDATNTPSTRPQSQRPRLHGTKSRRKCATATQRAARHRNTHIFPTAAARLASSPGAAYYTPTEPRSTTLA